MTIRSVDVQRRPLWSAGKTVILLVVIAILWSYLGTNSNLLLPFQADGRHQVSLFFGQLVSPNLSASLLSRALRGSVETLAVSIMGTLLAVLIGFPLGALSAYTVMGKGHSSETEGSSTAGRLWRRLIYDGSTLLLNFLRSVPELFWALIFIVAVGLGPFPGALALGFHTGGVLGKLYSESLEALDSRPLEALRATGAGTLKVFLFGMVPLALPQLLSYTLYRWEVNIRTAAVLGVVGAGGLGQDILVAMGLLQYRDLATLLIATLIIVIAVDFLSTFLRLRLIPS